MGNECMKKIKEMIFLDVTELSLTERFKPIEEKRKKGISENSKSLMGIKLMTLYALDGSLGLEKKNFHTYLPFEQANLNSVQGKLCPIAQG